MKVFKNSAVVFVMFLFFVTAFSCGKEEESRKVDLEKQTGLDLTLLFSENYQETFENIGTGKVQEYQAAKL